MVRYYVELIAHVTVDAVDEDDAHQKARDEVVKYPMKFDIRSTCDSIMGPAKISEMVETPKKQLPKVDRVTEFVLKYKYKCPSHGYDTFWFIDESLNKYNIEDRHVNIYIWMISQVGDRIRVTQKYSAAGDYYTNDYKYEIVGGNK